METLKNLRLSLKVSILLMVMAVRDHIETIGLRISSRRVAMMAVEMAELKRQRDQLSRELGYLQRSVRTAADTSTNLRRLAREVLEKDDDRTPKYRREQARLVMALTEPAQPNSQFGIVSGIARWQADPFWAQADASKKVGALLRAA